MLLFKRIILLACLAVSAVVSAGEHEPYLGPQSEGAKDIQGALGTFPLYPETTYWKDSDGVSPGVAGCHYEIKSLKDTTPTGNAFGEVCTSYGFLIETNPGKGVAHSHKRDVGHPDLFDCNAWCKSEINRKKTHYNGGHCKAVKIDKKIEACLVIDKKTEKPIKSAKCVCY